MLESLFNKVDSDYIPVVDCLKNLITCFKSNPLSVNYHLKNLIKMDYATYAIPSFSLFPRFKISKKDTIHLTSLNG